MSMLVLSAEDMACVGEGGLPSGDMTGCREKRGDGRMIGSRSGAGAPITGGRSFTRDST